MNRLNRTPTVYGVTLAFSSLLSLACSSSEQSGAVTGGQAGAPAPTGGVTATGGTTTTGGNANTGGAAAGATSKGGTSTGGTMGGAGKAGASGGGSGGVSAAGGGAGGANGGQSAGGASGAPAGGGGEGPGGGGGSNGGAVAGGGADGGGTGGAAGGASGEFTVTSPGFMNMQGCSEDMQSACDIFPPELASYQDGPNVSPELAWTGVPADTGSFAVLLQDRSNMLAHWVIWNIPGDATGLAADVPQDSNMPATPAGSQQTSATFAQGDGYFGPGSACNVYEFVVYALQDDMFMPASTTDANAVRSALEDLSESEVRATASIRGRQGACSGEQMCNDSDMCAN